MAVICRGVVRDLHGDRVIGAEEHFDRALSAAEVDLEALNTKREDGTFF